MKTIRMNMQPWPIRLRLAGSADAKHLVPLCSRVPPEAPSQETPAPRDRNSHIAPSASAPPAKVAINIRAKRTTSAKNATGISSTLP